jgi:hypothetical protein
MSLFMIENIIFLKIFTKETNTHRYLMLLFFILTFFGSKTKILKKKDLQNTILFFLPNRKESYSIPCFFEGSK